MEKHSVSRLSYLFAHLHLLSSDLFSSDSSHLCFSTVHIVGSFTSKLPSIKLNDMSLRQNHKFLAHDPPWEFRRDAGASPFQNFVWRNLTLLEASSKGTCKAAVTNEAGEDLGLLWITVKIIQHWLSIFNLSRFCHLSKFFSTFSHMHQNAISGAEAKGHGPLRVRVCHSLHSEPLQY